MRSKSRLTRSPLILTAMSVAMSVASSSASLAQDSSDPHVRQAIRYLAAEKHEKSIFSILHFGATMGDYTVTSLHRIVDNDGAAVPGEFAIKIVYDWDTSFGTNTSTATFFFDRNGYVKGIEGKSTSILSPPFELANGAIQVVGELLIAIAKENGASNKDLGEMRKLVDKADSKGLLMFSMNLQLLAGF